jgi:hypothetical protein
MIETEIGQENTQEIALFNIEKNKCPRPSVNWLIPAVVIGVLLITAGVFLGLVIHRANTPSIYGSASGRTIALYNDLDAFDRITVENDGQVLLTRKFDIDEGTVFLSASGIAKEKAGKFLLKFDRTTMKYEGNSERVLNPKGKEIAAKKLLDSKIVYRNKDVLPNIILASYKRHVNGKSKWVSAELSRDDSTDIYSSTSKDSRKPDSRAGTPIWDFDLYNDPSGSFILRYPNYLSIKSSSSGKVHLESKEKDIKLIAVAIDGSDVPDLSVVYEDELEKRSQSGSIVYKVLKDGRFFVISGKDNDGGIFYLRESLKDGDIYSIETVYPEHQKAAGDAIIKTFTSFPEMNVIRLSGDLTQDSSHYPVEFKLTVSNDGNVSGYYWYKKYKESNHIDLSGKVSDNIPRTLTLVSGKGTEEWIFSSNSTGPFSLYSNLKGKMLKYVSNEARLAGNAPTKEYSFVLK